MLDKFISPHELNTAVLLLVFNRLDTTKKVFEAIRKAKPPRLYIAADGARANREDEDTKVKAVKEHIVSSIDWKCEVKTLFREQNLGSKMAVSGAIDWFFKNEEMGIILEDDCLPSQSFFWFCESLLMEYKDNDDVGAISGDLRGLDKNYFNGNDYEFCTYFSMWGWATWRTVWEQYNVEVFNSCNMDTEINNVLDNMNMSKKTFLFWSEAFKKVQLSKVDAWDYQFIFLLFSHRYLTVIPSMNLVSNIGFGEDATHTIDVNSYKANVDKREMTFPLTMRKDVLVNKKIDRWYENNEYRNFSYLNMLKRKIIKVLKWIK